MKLIAILATLYVLNVRAQIDLRLVVEDQVRVLYNGGLLCSGTARDNFEFSNWNTPVLRSPFDLCAGTQKITASVAPTQCDPACAWIFTAQITGFDDRCNTGPCIISPWGSPPTVDCRVSCSYSSLGTYTAEHHVAIYNPGSNSTDFVRKKYDLSEIVHG